MRIRYSNGKWNENRASNQMFKRAKALRTSFDEGGDAGEGGGREGLGGGRGGITGGHGMYTATLPKEYLPPY